jgi:chromosomal replication initiation ATPase DnaA
MARPLRIAFPGAFYHVSARGNERKAVFKSIRDRQKFLAARNIKLYLCRKHTGERLRTLGAQFGIGDAAVAQACKRFRLKLEKDRKLRGKIERFEKRLFLSNVEI